MTGTVARTTPYAWPYDGLLDPTRLALVVVVARADGQGEAASGDDEVDEGALARIAELASGTLGAGGVVVEVTTTPPQSRRGAVAARTSAPLLGVRGATHRITAGGTDGFFASTLDATLRALRRDQLLLCGQWLELGVHSTMRSANDRGYECLLVQDACLPYDRSLAPAARSQIEMSGGIFGAVGDTTAVLDALRVDTTHRSTVPERTPA